MDVESAVKGLEAHLQAFVESAKEKLENELPFLADLAEKAANNSALAAILGAVHLSEVPEFLNTIADMITKADAALAASKAAGVAEGTAAAQAAVPEPAPAESAQ